MRRVQWIYSAALLAAVMFGLSGCATTGGDDAPSRLNGADQSDADRRARARIELATAYYARGQMETALDEVKLAVQAKPDLSDAYNLRGLIYSSLGDLALAESSFKRALQLQPRDADALHNYGWFLCQQQRFKEAIPQLQAAVEVPQYRGMARSLGAKGICQAQAGLWIEAEGSLMRSFELDPSNPGTSMNLAEVLYHRADYERARFYVGRVNGRGETTNAQSLWLAVRIENKAGNAGKATDLGEQLKARFPKAPEVQLYERRRFDE